MIIMIPLPLRIAILAFRDSWDLSMSSNYCRNPVDADVDVETIRFMV